LLDGVPTLAAEILVGLRDVLEDIDEKVAEYLRRACHWYG